MQQTKSKPSTVCKKVCKDAVPVPFKNLSDFTGTYCDVCYKVLSYEKIKPLKKGKQEAPSAVVELPKIKAADVSSETKKPRKTKAQVEEKPEPQAAPAQAPEPPSPVVQTQKLVDYKEKGVFPVTDIHKNIVPHLLTLILVTENGEAFPCILNAQTEEKATAVHEKREAIRGKMVNIEFEAWEENVPMGVKYAGFVK